MGYFSKFLGISAALIMLSVSVVGAEEKDPLKARVPADQMADAKANEESDCFDPGEHCQRKGTVRGEGYLLQLSW